MGDKLRLYGFNNLTKTLSFNIYDVCYTEGARQQRDYVSYIDEQYNSERLTDILLNVAAKIGAQVLNLSRQDYDPQGASVNLLIAESPVPEELIDPGNNQGINQGSEEDSGRVKAKRRAVDGTLHAHLDKSHITVHSFPESHPNRRISTFRVDIDVATCGTISPLHILDYLIESFDSDVITIDYRVRGFTRDEDGLKHFNDLPMRSIQEHIKDQTLREYDAYDINIYQANIFHTRMMRKEVDLQEYLFNVDPYELAPRKRLAIQEQLQHEMLEIFSGINVYEEE